MPPKARAGSKIAADAQIDAADSDLVVTPLETVVDPDNFTPRLLALLSNALVWRESAELRRQFGLGTNDWRVISVLATIPGANSTEVSEFIDVNKAIVSKSVNVLAKRKLIALLDGPRGSRPMYLTRAGAEMHDQMLPVSYAGQELIHSHVKPSDVKRLNELLRRMLIDVKAMPATPDADHAAALPRQRATPAARSARRPAARAAGR